MQITIASMSSWVQWSFHVQRTLHSTPPHPPALYSFFPLFHHASWDLGRLRETSHLELNTQLTFSQALLRSCESRHELLPTAQRSFFDQGREHHWSVSANILIRQFEDMSIYQNNSSSFLSNKAYNLLSHRLLTRFIVPCMNHFLLSWSQTQTGSSWLLP